jgi:hypothetical protein
VSQRRDVIKKRFAGAFALKSFSMGGATPIATKPRGGFFRALWRAARQVFHESIGAVFFLLALMWANAALRYWRQRAANWEWRTSVGMALVMTLFGLISFRAARRVR